MVSCRIAIVLTTASSVLPLLAEQPAITYIGHETVTPAADGGLQPVMGVHNIQVYRANRTAPAHQDGLNHTYLHAPMLAYWRGQFYLDYLSGPVSEHEPPCPTSYTTSRDGVEWAPPRVLFPSFALPDGTQTLTHQRTSFYVSPDDRLLATAFHGKPPSPNDGTGVGRVVREIKEDGSLGPIYFIRYNRHAGWSASNTPYPLYTASPDAGFVRACEALLADKLMTMQWWEEDQSEDGFYRVRGKAFSFVRRPDGALIAVAKDAQHAISMDDGETWTRLGFMGNMPVNSSKYWVQRTSDARYALVLNPTSRLRHPLAVLTSDDAKHFDGLLTIHGELPVQRFPGLYKNMGPQYVRGILPGNGTPPGGDLWLTYSVNKEDIWVSRVPVPITGESRLDGVFEATFDDTAVNAMPTGWNVYRPLWAPTQVIDAGGERGRALELRDEDPYDYAAATRVFPASRSVRIRFKLLAQQVDGRFEIDVIGARGERPVQVAFTPGGKIEAKHEGIWMPAGEYIANRWTDIEIDVNPGKNVDRFQFRVDGREVLYRIAYFSELVSTVERITFRTGEYRFRGDGGRELPDADRKSKLHAYLLDDLRIEPRD
jgi:hypothetical protein